MIVLFQLPVGQTGELDPNGTDCVQNSPIKGVLMDHVSLSTGSDPTNDLLINTMLS